MRELLKNFTILYVEDDKDTNEVISSILKSNFKEVHTAYNGQEGLAAYKQNRPDIVLSDIQMPMMNGIEMATSIKEINPHQEIAIFTAFNEPDHLKKAVNIGISKYILKPINEEQFFGALLSMAKVIQADIDHETTRHLLEVQSKTAAVGDMIGYIAHQWRQPLASISAMLMNFHADLEFERPVSKEEHESFIKGVQDNIMYLSNTINDFRHFFHSDDGQIEEFGLDALLNNLMTLTGAMLKDEHIEVVLDVQENITIKQEKNSLLHAILNIINNAKDAFVQGGVDPKSRYLFIHASKDEKGLVSIRIKDSAGGIDESIIKDVFLPYSTTKFQDQGTGIGMHMCYQIIHNHFKGEISAMNREYTYDGKKLRGAEFKMVFKDHMNGQKK